MEHLSSNAYGFRDVDKDGRISRSEFENCWRGSGFYREPYYNPDYWTHYWSAFDANNDGFLSADKLVGGRLGSDRPNPQWPDRFRRMGLVEYVNCLDEQL